jgi:hypothetical protein
MAVELARRRFPVDESHRMGEAGYQDSQRVTRGGRVAPDAFPDVPLPIDDVLG